jgi:hypothetical protein
LLPFPLFQEAQRQYDLLQRLGEVVETNRESLQESVTPVGEGQGALLSLGDISKVWLRGQQGPLEAAEVVDRSIRRQNGGSVLLIPDVLSCFCPLLSIDGQNRSIRGPNRSHKSATGEVGVSQSPSFKWR